MTDNNGDPFTVSIVGGLPPNSELVGVGNGMYEFRITLTSVANSFALEILAEDDQNAGYVFSTQVQICACMNGGTCTTVSLVDLSLSPLLLACDCTSAPGEKLYKFMSTML